MGKIAPGSVSADYQATTRRLPGNYQTTIRTTLHTPINYQVFPSLPKLSPLVMHIMTVELDGCEAFLPATLCPAIMLFARGGGVVVQADQAELVAERFFLRGPFMEPMHVRYKPRTLALSVCFRPGMLQQAMGINVAGIAGNVLPFHELVSAKRVQAFLQALDDIQDISAIVALFQEFLLEVLDHKPRSSMGAAFLAAHKKIFFPLLELSDYFGIGQRQLERRVRENFGVTLRDVRRIVRFGFSLPHIIRPDVAWGDLTQIAQDTGYYDQAHMHREYVELAGIPPAQLRQKISARDPAYWIYLMPDDDFNKLFLLID
ncbi:helix-turn-helix domain-containing protein [Undibacterium sp. Ji42W]|uniref:AraC family transcriptional regulator n=1 Tax=Undibacterium sp. Ji42W TaxID=3413039 RepID=UPI003BF0FD67